MLLARDEYASGEGIVEERRVTDCVRSLNLSPFLAIVSPTGVASYIN